MKGEIFATTSKSRSQGSLSLDHWCEGDVLWGEGGVVVARGWEECFHFAGNALFLDLGDG